MPMPTSRCCWPARAARAPGTQGPRHCSPCRGGSRTARRNSYRIVRLKDKLGTRSMASGEIILDGAVAYLVGDVDQGFKQMMEQVNLSRLSHGVRAAAMMRRCLNEALAVARDRRAFGKRHRRVSAAAPPADEDHAADRAGAVDVRLLRRRDGPRPMQGDKDAANLLRILTPVYKFRACRDNIPVASRRHGGARRQRLHRGMGDRRGWCATRRSACCGRAPSNINALDVVQRAVGKAGGHKTLTAALKAKYERERQPARPVQGPARRHARSRRALRRSGRRRSQAREALPASPPARSITPRRRR